MLVLFDFLLSSPIPFPFPFLLCLSPSKKKKESEKDEMWVENTTRTRKKEILSLREKLSSAKERSSEDAAVLK